MHPRIRAVLSRYFKTRRHAVNLVGDSFTHLSGGNKGYSVHGKRSKFVKWVFDGSASETFYLDQKLSEGLKDGRKGVKYGWLLESKFITEGLAEEVSSNVDLYFDTYRYIFTHNNELLDLDPRFKWCPASGFWIQRPRIHKKSKLVSFITSTKSATEGHKLRLEWLRKLENSVDVFGRGIREIASKEEGLSEYMFSVVIENGIYKSYFTEKILDCFATGTIPVYLGAPDIGQHFNAQGIIPLQDNFSISEEIYRSRRSAIQDNFYRAQLFGPLDDFLYTRYLVNELAGKA